MWEEDRGIDRAGERNGDPRTRESHPIIITLILIRRRISIAMIMIITTR